MCTHQVLFQGPFCSKGQLGGVVAPWALNSRGEGEASWETSDIISHLIIVLKETQQGSEKVTVCLNRPHRQRPEGLKPPPCLSPIPQGCSPLKVRQYDSCLRLQHLSYEDHFLIPSPFLQLVVTGSSLPSEPSLAALHIHVSPCSLFLLVEVFCKMIQVSSSMLPTSF